MTSNPARKRTCRSNAHVDFVVRTMGKPASCQAAFQYEQLGVFTRDLVVRHASAPARLTN
jgi:hypothetical protein